MPGLPATACRTTLAIKSVASTHPRPARSASPLVKIVALDLSMKSTGVVVVDTASSPADWQHLTLVPPYRKATLTEIEYDHVRYRALMEPLVGLLVTHRPQILAVEITRHAHGYVGGKRSNKNIEFKSGLYLGIARGWLTGALHLAQAYGVSMPTVQLVESSVAKKSATGNAAARKTAVKDQLAERLGLDLQGWGADEVDALAVATSVLGALHASPG